MALGIWAPPPTQKPFAGTLLDPTHALGAGLTFCHLYNEGGGNPYDYGQNGLTATPLSSRVLYRQGLRNSGLWFDPSLSYVTLSAPPADPRTSSFTFIAYVHLGAFTGSAFTLWGLIGTSSATVLCGFDFTGAPVLVLNDTSTSISLTGSVSAPLGANSYPGVGALTQVVYTWDLTAKSGAIYLNGALVASGNNGSLNPATLPVPSSYLGGTVLTSGAPAFSFYSGVVESVSVYAEAKPAAFIAAHNQAPYGGFMNPMLGRWYSFPGGAAPALAASASARKRFWVGRRN